MRHGRLKRRGTSDERHAVSDSGEREKSFVHSKLTEHNSEKREKCARKKRKKKVIDADDDGSLFVCFITLAVGGSLADAVAARVGAGSHVSAHDDARLQVVVTVVPSAPAAHSRRTSGSGSSTGAAHHPASLEVLAGFVQGEALHPQVELLAAAWTVRRCVFLCVFRIRNQLQIKSSALQSDWAPTFRRRVGLDARQIQQQHNTKRLVVLAFYKEKKWKMLRMGSPL